MKRNRLHLKEEKKLRRLARSKPLWRYIVVSMLCMFFLASCGGSSPPSSVPPKGTSQAVQKKKVEPTKGAEKKEPEKMGEAEYTYNASDKPDPFKPFIQITSAKENSRTLPLTPLQKYEVSQLKLVAIIIAREGNIALVEDSAGKGYFLKKGTEIGKNDGKVKTILKDKVVIEESYEDIFGQKKKNEISLFLQRIEEGGDS